MQARIASPVFSWQRCVVIGILSLILLFVLSTRLTLPYNQRLSQRFLDRGDTYLIAREFEESIKQYEKALKNNSDNALARERLKLARQASLDIAALRDFYAEKGVREMVDKIDLSTQAYSTPKAALTAGVRFYEDRDYVFAQYPLRRALKLDSGYPEAWHYLGLTYREMAKIEPEYNKQAEEAWQKRDQLTTRYITEKQ